MRCFVVKIPTEALGPLNSEDASETIRELVEECFILEENAVEVVEVESLDDITFEDKGYNE